MAKSSNILLKEKLISDIKANGQVPNHVAIIMDGNGRWAKKRNLPRVAGHKKGVETVREIVKTCVEVGVNYLTIYTFSTENWKRPKDEVSTLMRLIVKSLQNETDELHSNGVKLTATGDINSLPFIVQKELRDAFIKTQDNSKLVLNLALSYSGRWEIVEAVKKIAGKISNKELLPEDICENIISENLLTNNIPDPDLLIRSGGEFRVSNFLLWQIAYSELYFTETLWPDFKAVNFLEAINDYQSRERRFGLVSEQISKKNERKREKNTVKV